MRGCSSPTLPVDFSAWSPVFAPPTDSSLPTDSTATSGVLKFAGAAPFHDAVRHRPSVENLVAQLRGIFWHDGLAPSQNPEEAAETFP